MNFEPNHIDDLFRQRLHDAEAAPPAFVWQNVERQLQKRKRRRFVLWLFAFGIAGAGLWAMFTRHEAQQPEASPQQQVFLEKNENLDLVKKSGNQVEGDYAAQQNTSKAPLPAKKASTKPLKPISYAPMCIDDSKIKREAPLYLFKSLTAFEILQADDLNTPLAFSRKNNLPQAELFIRKKKKDIHSQHCYDFEKNPNVWLLDVYAGPSFSQRTLTTTDPAYEPYAQMRRSTEQTDWAFNAGVRGSLLLGRHFLLRSGLHYEQMTEVFEYADPAYVKYIVEIINKPGEPPIIDTVGVEYGENYTKTYNRYGLLDVPLEVGGEVRSGRFGLSINAGVSFNVLFWKRGTVLSPSGQPTPFTPGEKGAEEIYRPSAGWSAGASGQVFFHLQPTLRVFAEPYFKKILKPLTLDGQPVEQRYGNWGLKMGVTKILD